MSLMQRGFTRLYANGQVIELNLRTTIARDDFKDVYVLVDRLTARPDVRQRLVDSLENCFQEGHGSAVIETADAKPQRLRFSERFECKYDGTVYATPEPRLFSFNNPYGACPTCQGFGNTIGLDLDLVIPNPGLSLKEGAIEPWTKPQHEWAMTELKQFCRCGKDLDDRAVQSAFALGSAGDHRRTRRLRRRARILRLDGDEEIQTARARLSFEVSRLHVVSRLQWRTPAPGSARRESRRTDAAEICAMSIKEAASFFDSLELSTEQTAIADRILFEVRRRLRFLVEVGLDYLTLDRLASTLSGGEAQRIQLATNLGSSLVGALYVLDEPSIGLHPRDNDRLIRLLKNLRDIGNTVLVVEHDAEMMRSADHILDIGPAAGELGGRVMYEGDFAGLLKRRDVADRAISAWRRRDQGAETTPRRAETTTYDPGRVGTQPEIDRRRNSARHARLRHRRQRLGQVNVDSRLHLRRIEETARRLARARRRVSRNSKAGSLSTM